MLSLDPLGKPRKHAARPPHRFQFENPPQAVRVAHEAHVDGRDL